NKEVFHKVSESFQGESFSSSLNDNMQQSQEEVILPQTNTQSIPINMIPNGDEASTSHNVFNERLKDAYFDASASFYDPSNVHTYYQPYPPEKKCHLLNDYEDVGKLKAKGDIEVFVGYSKESAAFRIYNKRTRESSSFSLNDDVQQSPKEVILPQKNTQSIPINMVPNSDEASTSHNVFNERLEDAYFDAKRHNKMVSWKGGIKPVEAARTMLTFANLPSFLWAKAIATACFTQNRSIIHKRFNKTPYELINKRKPNIKFFRVFGCRCYLLNDYEDVGKLKAKGDIGVFIGY
nr:retrovirus-related Pol polyprotein from transposon TNT 1-94 [Tanacetum cinerariifolium]